jgi:hypothetical protein
MKRIDPGTRTMRASTLAVAILAGLLPSVASAGEPAPYTVEVEVLRGGRTTSATVEVPAGGSGSATSERRIPYAAALASAEAEEIPDLAAVVVANSFRVAPVERPGGVGITADIRLSELSGMRRYESGGRTVDLPEVETVDVAVRDAAMRPEGGAWVYEGEDAKSGSRLRIVARR